MFPTQHLHDPDFSRALDELLAGVQLALSGGQGYLC